MHVQQLVNWFCVTITLEFFLTAELTSSHNHSELNSGWETYCLSRGGGDLHLHCDSGISYWLDCSSSSCMWMLLLCDLHAPSDQRMRGCSNASSPVQCTEFDFQGTITSVGSVVNGAADMTSTFRFTTRAGLNGTVVECTGATSPPTSSESHTFTVASMHASDNVAAEVPMKSMGLHPKMWQ